MKKDGTRAWHVETYWGVQFVPLTKKKFNAPKHTHTILLSFCLWQCFPLMSLHTKHQGSIMHIVAGSQ